ncbi:MAG: hypothetical protein Q9227_003883 [Pyrenula ochraceoflavens]
MAGAVSDRRTLPARKGRDTAAAKISEFAPTKRKQASYTATASASKKSKSNAGSGKRGWPPKSATVKAVTPTDVVVNGDASPTESKTPSTEKPSASAEDLDFSLAPSSHTFDGLLFDFDGTIIDSTDAIVKHWHKLAKELNVDPEVILATSHGRRSVDTLQLYDPSKANWEYVSHIEGLIPKEFGQDAVEIPGARNTLVRLEDLGVPWAIVTSGTNALVSGWIDVLKLAQPKNLVVAEDVQNGKPDPQCYLLGREKLDLPTTARCLVIEDAPSGVKAGKAAGFKVLGLATTHRVEQLVDAGADWIVRDMRSLRVERWDSETGKVEIRVEQGLKI